MLRPLIECPYKKKSFWHPRMERSNYRLSNNAALFFIFVFLLLRDRKCLDLESSTHAPKMFYFYGFDSYAPNSKTDENGTWACSTLNCLNFFYIVTKLKNILNSCVLLCYSNICVCVCWSCCNKDVVNWSAVGLPLTALGWYLLVAISYGSHQVWCY